MVTIERVRRTWSTGECAAACAAERRAMGSDWGSEGYATRAQVDELPGILRLRPGTLLLDVGGGQGWPGLYLARKTGCTVTIVDPYFDGLAAATRRASQEGITKLAVAVLGHAEALPVRSARFDAVVHTDVLCCLDAKATVLEAALRSLRPGGRTAFTVIFPAPGLPPAARQRAVEAGPDLCATPAPYPDLLHKAGYDGIEERDLTTEFLATERRKLAEADRFADGIVELFGRTEFEIKQQDRRQAISAIEDGLLRRSLFVAHRPA